MSDLEISSDEDQYDHDTDQVHNRCTTCGSSRFYRDTETDNLICSDCYTQSQTLSQRETIDLDDVFSKKSNLRRVRINRKPVSRDEDLDNSRPLPDLVTCLHACQLILKIMAVKSYTLAQVHTQDTKSSFDSDQEAFVNLVGVIWLRYLEAWKEAAIQLSDIFPEHRFSFRDYFLSSNLRGMIVKHLSARSMKDLMSDESLNRSQSSSKGIQSIPIDNATRKRKRVTFDDSQQQGNDKNDTRINGENSDIKIDGKNEKKRRRHSTVRFYRPIYRHRRSLLSRIPSKEGEMISKECAALQLEPSYSLFASIIYLAFIECKMGVSSFHIRSWLSNGSIPHGNAAYLLLPKEIQDRLDLVQNFFHQNFVPTSAIIEQQVDFLIIACRIHPLVNSNASVDSFAKCQMQGFSHVGHYNKDISRYINRLGKEVTVERIIPFIDNIPLMTMRFVADLGLPQQILDYSLAIMGFFHQDKKFPSDKSWLPPILNSASAGRIVSPVHILAVIVVACKMSPGWERWSIYLRSASSIDDETSSDNSSGVKRDKSIGQRFVPISQSHLNLVNNGALMDQYLNFLEESVAPSIPGIPQYQKIFARGDSNHTDNSDVLGDRLQSQSANEPSIALAGISDLSFKMTKKFREANGIGQYVVYTDFRTHAATISGNNVYNHFKQTCRPFHSHYGLLIEYIAYVFTVEPSELHYLVACFDEELLKTGKKIKGNDK